MSFNPLQRVVWPSQDNLNRYGLYLMPCEASIDLNEGHAKISGGQKIDLCSFYNSFSHNKWREVCGINNISAQITGVGTVKVRLLAWTPTAASIIVSESIYDLTPEGVNTSYESISKIAGLSLSLEIEAISPIASVHSITWGTLDAPKREISLKVVVTTFNRPKEILGTIKKFSENILPYNQGHQVEVIVVNNGEDFCHAPKQGIKIIKNKNLGGAGGFTRGLIEVIDEGAWSHCLFMDDDASCEAESIYRVINLLAYAKDIRTAVSGSMFVTDKPTVQYEKGAIFSINDASSPLWQSIGSMRDMTDRGEVVSNDGTDIANYGAWWFFCFPVSQVRHLAFPFFVRGDDVDFSLSNDFKITTLNGVSCWSENFGYKLTPVTEYLTWRSWPALAFMHSDPAVIRKAILQAFRASIKLGLRFDYGGMFSVQHGLRHCLEGPSYFGLNPSPVPYLKNIRALDSATIPATSEIEDSEPVPFHRFSQRRTVLSLLTCGGHLIPDFLLRNKPRHTRIAWEAGSSGMLRAKISIFGEGLALRKLSMDRKLFFSGLLSAIKIYFLAIYMANKVYEEYRMNAEKYKTRDYWISILN